MHQIILITAMSATTGLFGGGKHCGGKVHHGRAAYGCSTAAYSAPSPCGWSATTAMPSTSAPMTYPGSPQMASPGSPPMAPTKSPVPTSVPAAPSVPTAPVVPAPPPPSASYAPAAPGFYYQAVKGPAWARCATR